MPLPEIDPVAAPGDDARAPDVIFTIGSIADHRCYEPTAIPGLAVAGGTALLSIGGVARYRVQDGRTVTIAADPAASARDVRLFLLGSAFGIVCHQRGLLPLHANALVVNGGAVAFAGDSGAGKSTLAAYFQRSGYPVLCDDLCVVGFDAGGSPVVWPGLPRLKLWRQAAAHFGHEIASSDAVWEAGEKFHMPFSPLTEQGPLPLRRLYVLERHTPDRSGAITRLRGAAAYQVMRSQTYRHQYLQALGLGQGHFERCIAALASVEVYTAPRHWGYEVFTGEAERLASHFLDH